MNIFFFFKHIPFEVNVASGFQVNGSEVVIVWFIGLGVEAIEILLPLLLCKQMSLPYSPQLPLSPSVSPAVSRDTHSSMCRALPLNVMSCVSIKALQLNLQQLLWYIGENTEVVILWIRPCVGYLPSVNSSRPRYWWSLLQPFLSKDLLELV